MPRQCSYNPCGNKCLERRRVKSVRYGTEAISFLAPKILEFLRNEIKDSNTLQIFKTKIKRWVTVECPVHYAKSFYVKEDLYICNFLSPNIINLSKPNLTKDEISLLSNLFFKKFFNLFVPLNILIKHCSEKNLKILVGN